MYYFELFSHADRFSYRAFLLSGGTVIFVSCMTLTLLPPFLLTYYTGDFWPNQSVYSEQPRIQDRLKYIVVVDTDATTNSRYFLSSYASLNRNLQTRLIPGSVSQTSFDMDGDGLLDQFRVTFDLIFSGSTVKIQNMNIFLIFQYETNGKQRINMETMAVLTISPPSILTPTLNKNITVYGKLVFDQRRPIQSSGNDSTYNTSIVDTASFPSAPDLNSILTDYYSRNYYTSFRKQYTWITSRLTSSSNTLTINAVVNVGRQSILYTPGFWQNFKWGWIQYVCVLVPFMLVFSRLKLFTFSNNLVRTIVTLPGHRHKA